MVNNVAKLCLINPTVNITLIGKKIDMHYREGISHLMESPDRQDVGSIVHTIEKY